MLPQRFITAQSNIRKSRMVDGKPSMLPKPRRPGSTDRLSSEARRPSVAPRSSSAEPSRVTFAGRLSREASATKLPISRRSRSQQGFGQSSVTPMRSSQYAARPTNTPQRTPSSEHKNRTWQMSLDRVLAFVTVPDQRPISQAAWQRAETVRVQEALAARAICNTNVFVRPLTIARFVDITGALLAVITLDAKLNTDNYITKLPHLTKRLLYPAPVSKSWLKTVNTLHAFPQALALVVYLLDLANDIETPVNNELLYVAKDEVACLRQQHLHECWIRFQGPQGKQFEDLRAEYLQNLESLLGNDEDKVLELQQLIKKYETCLEDEMQQELCAEEARLVTRRDALLHALRTERAARRDTRATTDEQLARRRDLAGAVAGVDAEIDRAHAESQRLKQELETQEMSVTERTKLVEDIAYALRVQDSKEKLANRIAQRVLCLEEELTNWQKATLDCCVAYRQGLIQLSARHPHLARYAVDEKELMGAECGQRVSQAVDALRECSHELHQRRGELARARTALGRRRAELLEENRTKIRDIKASVQREQETLEAEAGREASQAAEWGRELAVVRDEMEALLAEQRNHARIEHVLQFWEEQDELWRSKLASLRSYIESKREEARLLFEEACAHRTQLVIDAVATLVHKLDQC